MTELGKLETGFEFPQASFQLDASTVAAYCRAVEEPSSDNPSNPVPPMAVATLSLAALLGGITFPEGAIHVSQEFHFKGTAHVDDTITTRSRVGRNQNRGRLHLMDLEIEAANQDAQVIMTGKTSLILQP